ncbi:hypothetical protein ACFLVX_01475 [Chloroflexota bacterium]
MIGPITAMLSAVCFSESMVSTRRGIYRSGESFTALPVSIFPGILLFTLPLLISREGGKLEALSWLIAGSPGGSWDHTFRHREVVKLCRPPAHWSDAEIPCRSLSQ